MTNFKVDLTNCDRELIHIPGQVQSHGFLVAVDKDFIIRYCSENIAGYINEGCNNLIGQSLQHLKLLASTQISLASLLNDAKERNLEEINPAQVTISGKPFHLIVSSSNKYYLLEFEPALNNVSAMQKMISRAISLLVAEKKLQNLLHNAAEQVKRITTYDRVMIYRFAEDGHGEVVAEAKNDALESWMGLHYPASDIPRQARALYKLNLTRLIADVYATPSKIVAEASNTNPLDLTYSQLRAVSPIHIQYLKNMNVASSFSISLLYKNELWGLIACHNYTPRFIDYRSRESSKLVGQIVSSSLEFRLLEEDYEQREYFKSHLLNLSRGLQENIHIEDALTGGKSTILNITHAAGAAVLYDKKRMLLGNTPTESQLDELLEWAKVNITEAVFTTTNLSGVYPPAIAYKGAASGMMLLQLSKELGEYIIWFKPEILKTVTWAGNPDKPALANADGTMNLSPRNSFDAWSQSVLATSEKWSVEEVKSAETLQQEVLHAANIKTGSVRVLNESLRRAYEELDTFSYTISHDLKNPLTAVKGYAQLLAMDAEMKETSKEVLRRIVDKADQMNEMMNAILTYSHLGKIENTAREINMNTLVKELVKDLDPAPDETKLKITVKGLPPLVGEPTLTMQVFSNLIGNAIKYSKQSQPALIEISGNENEKESHYIIKDNGIGMPENSITEIFGLFKRLSSANNIEGSGVGLAIVKRIMEKHNGNVWVESETGKGSSFHVVFKKNFPIALSPLHVETGS